MDKNNKSRPKPKYDKKKKGKKYFKNNKSKPKQNAVVTVGKVIGGFGDRYFCELEVYDATFSITAAATFARYTMNVSDLKNAINGVTDAPSGWNTLADVYNKFIVHAGSIIVKAVNTSATIPINMAIFPSNFEEISGDLNNYEEWSEYPYCKNAILTPVSGSRSSIIMKHSMASKKIFGTKKLSSVDENYVGYTGSAQSSNVYTVPTEMWRFILGFNTLDGTTNIGTGTILCNIKMKFKIEFFERLKGY